MRRQELAERRFQFDVRDLERKEASALRQERLLQNLLGPTPTVTQTSSIPTNINIEQGEDAAINSLQNQRNKLLPALTVPGAAEVAKAKISEIDEQIKFQRTLAKEKRKQEEKLTPENAAKVSLVKTGRAELKKATSLLKDKQGKFNTGTIFAMRAGTPGTKGRQARSLMLNAINAQLRAESGAAVPEEEVNRAFERFVPSPLDDDATKQQKLDSLDSLLSGTLELVKGPPQLEEVVRVPTAVQQPATFISVQEAEAANLPVGTIITINGRRAIVE